MKKILSFAAVCALLISCGGKNNADAPIQDFSEGESAGGALFNEEKPTLPLTSQTGLKLDSMELQGNETYLGIGEETVKGSKTIAVTGRFSTSQDGTINFTTGPLAGGKLIRNGNLFKFIFGTQEIVVNGTFTPTPVPTDPILVALCGAHWKFSSIKVTAPKYGIDVSFSDNGHSIDPNDIEAIAQYVNEKADKEVIPMSKVSGYKVKAISLSPAPKNTVCVEFENNVDPIYGTWDPSAIKSGNFSYHMAATLDGQLFSADANGTFSLENNNNILVLNLAAKSGSDIANLVIKAKKIK